MTCDNAPSEVCCLCCRPADMGAEIVITAIFECFISKVGNK